MAQDFSRAFGYGDDNKRISIVDAQGVSFASIQALYRVTRGQQQQITALRAQNKSLSDRLARIEARLGIQSH
jgi:hypothetical protein